MKRCQDSQSYNFHCLKSKGKERGIFCKDQYYIVITGTANISILYSYFVIVWMNFDYTTTHDNGVPCPSFTNRCWHITFKICETCILKKLQTLKKPKPTPPTEFWLDFNPIHILWELYLSCISYTAINK